MIQDFENYLRSLKGYSENTCQEYVKDIRHFAKWVCNNLPNARWSLITRKQVDAYITAEVSRGLKPATTNRKLASIAAYYNWMIREGMDVENPCKYESRRKRPEQAPNLIPISELNQAYQKSTGAVKYLLGLLMTTGMRIQEVLDMTWECINYENSSIKVVGKGGKSRIVYTTPDVLAPARQAAQANPKHGKMWGITQRRARFLVWQALSPYCHAQQLSPHAIRHTFATHIATTGCNVSTLAQILGHNHLETTQKYIDLGQAPVQRYCQQYNLLQTPPMQS